MTDGSEFVRANLLTLRNTRIANLLGLPAITLPTGHPACGISLLGHAGQDRHLLRVAAGAEARWRDRVFAGRKARITLMFPPRNGAQTRKARQRWHSPSGSRTCRTTRSRVCGPLLSDIEPGLAPGESPMILTIGEPRHPMPGFVAQVMADSLPELAKYPPNEGAPELLSAIGGWLDRRYGLDVSPDRLMVLNGTREGLFNAALALCPRTKAGQQPIVLVPNPFYQVYAVAAPRCRRRRCSCRPRPPRATCPITRGWTRRCWTGWRWPICVRPPTRRGRWPTANTWKRW